MRFKLKGNIIEEMCTSMVNEVLGECLKGEESDMGKSRDEEYDEEISPSMMRMSIKGEQSNMNASESQDLRGEDVKGTESRMSDCTEELSMEGKTDKEYAVRNVKGTESDIHICCKKIKMMELKGTESEIEICCKKIKLMGVSDKEPNDGREEHTKKRTSVRFLKGLHRRKWEENLKWEDSDLDRKIDSREALPEQLHDYESNMVLIGSGVKSPKPRGGADSQEGQGGCD